MSLITWRAVGVTILAIIGLGCNVFVSGVYKGAQKIMANSNILKKMTEKEQQLVDSTENGSEEKVLKRPVSNNFGSNLNV